MNLDQFRKRMQALPPLPQVTEKPSWLDRRNTIRGAAMTGDPGNELLKWAVLNATMIAHDESQAAYEFAILMADNVKRWARGLADNGEFGGIVSDIVPFNTTNSMLHQAYPLMRWEFETGRRVESLDRIVEFGGGYGAMARLIHNLGFRGEYVIYDFPELSLVQEFYLSGVGVPVRCISEPERIDCDLLIGLWSLSEAPPKIRGKFLSRVTSKSHLFTYAPAWDGWDNEKWFGEFMQSVAGERAWNIDLIQHGHYLMIGDR